MIAFAAPWALLGLAAAALPLLLHLMQRREPPEVLFPAVRYLEDATRDQSRHLKLRNWLLLAVRTALIVALVLAAAGATLRGGGVGAHAPSALVLVVDNSASSGAVIDGEPVLTALVRAASRVLDRATLADHVWLLAADGVARAGTAAQLRTRLGELGVEPSRLDLGAAITQGRDLIRGSGRAGEVVVVTDAQRTAVAAARGTGPVLVLRPSGAVPANRGIVGLSAGAQPWGPEGGRVTITVASSDTAPVPVTLSVGERTVREVLVTPGVPSVQHVGAVPAGWTTLTATLPPDEFRLDDTRTIALRIAPPALVDWDTRERYINAALAVLAADGRVRQGNGIHFGVLGPGPSVVLPPDDPAQLGALNRALAARGSSWRYGTVIAANARTDSGAFLPARDAVSRRVSLEASGTAGDVLATVDGAPWLVRSGDLLLLGSRLDPDWTALPLSAEFVPFLDAVVTRAARGEPPTPDAIAGEPLALPDRVTAIAHDGTRVPADASVPWRPAELGVFHLLAGTDTLGAVSVRLDPRESDLARAADGDMRSLWSGSTVAALDRGSALAFAATGRSDLRGVLLVLALCCALTETALAGRAIKRS